MTRSISRWKEELKEEEEEIGGKEMEKGGRVLIVVYLYFYNKELARREKCPKQY